MPCTARSLAACGVVVGLALVEALVPVEDAGPVEALVLVEVLVLVEDVVPGVEDVVPGAEARATRLRLAGRRQGQLIGTNQRPGLTRVMSTTRTVETPPAT